MTIRGEADTSTFLSSRLSPAGLVRLTCDILYSQGHGEIRIMDGPGDGGRDIHSLTPDGRKHLTQCKFHKKIKKTVSSLEISELPSAMIKFGYKSGLFVTNARISPQGKREFLSDYPGLELSFFDGESVVAAVLGDGVLRSVWLSGKSIADANMALAFPAIIRRHSDDASIYPFTLPGCPPPDDCLAFLESKHSDLKFGIRPNRGHPDSFEPYRAPYPFTKEEGAFFAMSVVEIAVVGGVALHSVEALLEDIGQAILLWMGIGITVRVGAPSLTSLTGENPGGTIASNVEPVSFVSASESWVEEREWFSLNSNRFWTGINDARVTEAGAIRLYSEDIDCVALYEIRCRPSAQHRSQLELSHENRMRGWERSVFALLPINCDWAEIGISPPDERAVWPWDGRLLCGWLHWNLLGRPISTRSASGPDLDLWGKPSEEAQKERFDLIRAGIGKITGVQIVTPEEARHMVALVGVDPLEIKREVVFRTAELINCIEDVPSPILPQARGFGFSVAWRSDVDADLVKVAAASIGDEVRVGYLGGIEVRRHGGLLLLSASVVPADIMTSDSDCVLDGLHDFLGVYVPRLEGCDLLLGRIVRCTRQFWSDVYGVNLGVSWRESGKVYAMAEPADGDLSLIGFPPELMPKRE